MSTAPSFVPTRGHAPGVCCWPSALQSDAARPQPLFLLLFLLMGLLPILPALHGSLPTPAPLVGPSQSITSGTIPDGLSAPEWQSIQAQIAAGPYRAYPADDGHFSSANPAHGWQIAYGVGGTTRLTPREAMAKPWAWALTLTSYGFATHIPLTPPHTLTYEADRLTYQWDASLSEWWRNTPNGLEQGFTLHTRPAGSAPGQPLHLDLALGGDLHPTIDSAGISFSAADGTTVLTYRGLRAWDATGRELPTRMGLDTGRISLTVDETNAIYPVMIDPWVPQAYLKASNTGAFNQFGWSVAISGDTLVVGAIGEASNARGVNGDQSNNSALYSGAAYVFVRTGSTWSQQAYLKASNTDALDQFGRSVVISGDTIVVGASEENSNATGVNGDQSNNSAHDSGAAYVFVRSGSTWSQQAYLKASNTEAFDTFGYAVALAGDTLVVGAIGEASNARGVNGDQSNNSAHDSGAAYVFVRSGSTWSQQAYLKASNTDADDQFGEDVALAGDTVVVGASWEASNATGVNGNSSDNSAFSAGAAYVFVRSGSTWSQQAYLKASNTEREDKFGYAVAISGNTLVVGAHQEDTPTTNSGAVYVFVRSGSTWSQQAYLKASNTEAFDTFGYAVALAGDTLVVGAPYESSNATGVNGNQSNNSANRSGAAYVFVRSGSIWSQQAYLKASNTDALDKFGEAVAISGDTIVVGAVREASNASGGQNDNSAFSAGAAYVFGLDTTRITQRVYIPLVVRPSAPTTPAARIGLPVGGTVASIHRPVAGMPDRAVRMVLIGRIAAL